MTGKDFSTREITIGEDWIVPEFDGPGRRTIIRAGAWTIPVVAVAASAPLAAASTSDPTLEFLGGPFATDPCSSFDTIVLHATTDGTTPASNEIVTVSLPDGLKWPDGTTAPKNFTTDGNGDVLLDGLVAPAAPGAYTVSAVSAGGLTASTSIVVSDTAGAVHRIDPNTGIDRAWAAPYPLTGFTRFETADNNVNASTSLALLDDGRLFVNEQLIDTGVVAADAGITGGTSVAYYIDSAGQLHRVNGVTGENVVQATGQPTSGIARFDAANNTTTGASTTSLLTTSGDLWVNTVHVDSGVVAADTGVTGGTAAVYYINSSGQLIRRIGSGAPLVQSSGWPTTGIARFEAADNSSSGGSGVMVLTTSGDLWFNGINIASGVVAADTGVSKGTSAVYYITSAGELVRYITTPEVQATGQPTTGIARFEAADNATDASAVSLLTTGGDLWTNGSQKRSNVLQADTGVSKGKSYVYYVSASSC